MENGKDGANVPQYTRTDSATEDSEKHDLATLRLELAHLKKLLDLQKDFAALRHQVELDVSHLKWIGATVGLLIAFLGFFGVKAWRDLTSTAEKALNKQVSDLSDQAFDLSRGFVLSNARSYREAIPYLTKCYERNHYDESVASALLDALASDGDYSSAIHIIDELKADPKRYRQITNPLLYNNIGRVLLYFAIDNRSLLDEAQLLLEKSLRNFAPDAYASKYPLFHLFRLYVVKGDLKRAAQYLAAAYRLDKGYGSPSYVADTWRQRLKEKMPAALKDMDALITNVRKSTS